MKLRAPIGCASVSHRGTAVNIGEDGSIEVDDQDWLTFASHGFTHCNETNLNSINCKSALDNPELVIQPKYSSSSSSEKASDGLKFHVEEQNVAPEGSDGFGQSGRMTICDAERIEKLNRNELFAFLRMQRVAVSLPITNDQLRRLARNAGK